MFTKWHCIVLCTMVFSIPEVYCQEPGAIDDSASLKRGTIQWVIQFPEEKTESPKRNLLKRLSDIVLGGDEQPFLSKPIAILARSTDTFFVLDQGLGSLLEVRDNTIDIPRHLKKELKGFPSLVGLCETGKKEILFTDSRRESIYRVSADLKEINLLNDSLSLQQPTGIAYNPVKQEIWVVETAAHRISILDEYGKRLRTLGSRGKGEGEFNFPTSLWIDKQGRAYVVDAMNFRVQIFDSEGKCISVFGEMGDASGYLARPKGIATDSYGNIYLADALFHAVQVFDISGNLLYTFGQQGSGKEEFWMPGGICVDADNNIYIADTYNARIQIFRLIMR